MKNYGILFRNKKRVCQRIHSYHHRSGREDGSLCRRSQTDTEALRYVQAGQRALDTLQQYTQKLHQQIAEKVSATENEGLYREIKSVIGMVDTMMQQYIKEEIDVIAQQNAHIRQVILIIAVFVGVLLLFMIIFSVTAYNNVMNSVIKPIRDMEEMTDRVRAGNLTAKGRNYSD